MSAPATASLHMPIPYRLPALALLAVILLAICAPLLAPYDPYHAEDGLYLQAPSPAHPLGTDTLGRDVLSRVLWGARQTLGMALLATAITIGPGLLIGILAGFYRGWADRLAMAVMDTLLAFPNLLLALTLIALTGTGPLQVALAVGSAGLPAYARVIRTATLEVSSQPYILAATASGATQRRILTHHILPNILGAALSFGAVSLSWSLLNGAALVFLGFGGNPATPDWGAMLAEGRAAFRVAPWIALPPGLGITLVIYAVNRLASAWQEDRHY